MQRVESARVTVDDVEVGAIGPGFLALVGVGHGDDEASAAALASTIAHLRVFADDAGKMNRSLLDTGGAVLVVSQFTLYADTSRGRRPSFTDAAPAAVADHLVDAVADALVAMGIPVAQGSFGAHMRVALVNDGPVTIVLDTDDRRS